jgi:hypothetical protein
VGRGCSPPRVLAESASVMRHTSTLSTTRCRTSESDVLVRCCTNVRYRMLNLIFACDIVRFDQHIVCFRFHWIRFKLGWGSGGSHCMPDRRAGTAALAFCTATCLLQCTAYKRAHKKHTNQASADTSGSASARATTLPPHAPPQLHMIHQASAAAATESSAAAAARATLAFAGGGGCGGCGGRDGGPGPQLECLRSDGVNFFQRPASDSEIAQNDTMIARARVCLCLCVCVCHVCVRRACVRASV